MRPLPLFRAPARGRLRRWLLASALLALPLALTGAAGAAEAPKVEAPKVEPPLQSGERAPLDAALIIGNEAYDALPQATWAGLDARAFKTWALAGRGVSAKRITYAEDIDRQTMVKLADKASRRVGKRGTMWVYFAGHGTVGSDGERALVGVDATGGGLGPASLPLAELSAAILKNKNVARVVFVLDAGFGNRGRDGLELVPGATPAAPKGWGSADPRVLVWAADRGLGQPQLFEPARHGLFTYAVLGALQGWADGELDGSPDGRVTFAEAGASVARMPALLGRAGQPTLDLSAAAQGWAIVTTDGMQKAPSRAIFAALAAEDRAARIAAAERRLLEDAEAFWADTLSRAQQGGPEGDKALQAYIDEFAGAELSLSWSVDVPRVQEAQKMLAGVIPRQAAASGGGGAAPAAPPEKCDELIELEGTALLGELSPGLQRCLEGRISTDRLQTTKNKVSRLLIANAEAAGRAEEWERLMQRHLEDIERSDPDLCMRYAVHLHKQGLESEEEALRWAGYALDNKHIWTGDEHVRKVSGLMRLRAEAANKLWRDADKRYTEDPVAENDKAAREFRGWTMDYAREWLDYARASGGKTDQAMVLCQTAAGTADFCKAGAP